MSFAHMRRFNRLDVITVILAVALAAAFLFVGVAELIDPDVPSSRLAENTRVCVTLIVSAVILIYALFRPRSGGYLLCMSAVPFAFIFYFHPFFSTAAGLMFLLGVMSVIRSRPARGAASAVSEHVS